MRGEDSGAGGPAGAAVADRAIDLVVLVMVLVGFVYALHLTRDAFFWADDLLLVDQGGSWAGLVDDYNGHLSILILAAYRGSVELFGFAYTPLRVIGTVSLFALPLAYYGTTRSRLTPPLAALLTIPLLWTTTTSFYPGELNHRLALLGGIGCAAALTRGRRADGVLAGSLAFSLCAAGGGVAVGAACVTHNLVVGASRRRWLATLAPLLAWGVWWSVAARGERSAPGSPSLVEGAERAWDLTFAAMRSIALGSSIGAVVLVVAFVVHAVWRLTQGRGPAGNVVAWTAALLAWGMGLTLTRSGEIGLAPSTVDPFRYQQHTLVFIALALVPSRPIRWAWTRVQLGSAARLAGVAMVLVVGLVWGAAAREGMQDAASSLSTFGQATRTDWAILALEPPVVDDGELLAFRFGFLTAGEVRALADRYGSPFPHDPQAVDEALVDRAGVRQRQVRGDVECDRLDAPLEYLGAGVPLFLWSDAASWTVEARRFGDQWIPLEEAGAGDVLSLRLPTGPATTPWEVRATGACRVGVQHWDGAASGS